VDLEPGHSLGRYRIEAKLGKGGFGSVYAAYDTLLQRRVALKVLGAIGHEKARLVAEARSAARLVHPNVVTVHEVESEGDVTYLVMELVPGLTLRKRAATASFAQKVEWLAQIADALAAAHAAGLVHRDVKPDNVVIGEATGTVKVLDFGIAKSIEPPATLAGGGPHSLAAPPVTATGKVVGTLRYMAPEQLLGHPLTPLVDQWAWGVLAYELLAGQHPGVVAEAQTIEEWILLGTTRRLGEVVPGIEPHVAAVVERTLARDPRQRFASMAEVASAMRERGAPHVAGPSASFPQPPTAPTAVVAPQPAPASFPSAPAPSGPSTQTGAPQPIAMGTPHGAHAAWSPSASPSGPIAPTLATPVAPQRRGLPGWVFGVGLGLIVLILAVGAAGLVVAARLASRDDPAPVVDAGVTVATTTTFPSAASSVGAPSPTGLASAGPPKVGTTVPPRTGPTVAQPATATSATPAAATGAAPRPGATCASDCDCPNGVCSSPNGGTCIACPAGQVGAHAGGGGKFPLGPGACGPPCSSPSSEDCPADRVCRNALGDTCARHAACVPPVSGEQQDFEERLALWKEMHAAYPTYDAYARAVQQVPSNPDGSCPADAFRSGGACLASCIAPAKCKRGATCFATGTKAKDGSNRPFDFCRATISHQGDWDRPPRLR
jgi:serine/threonine-protein kinase